MKIIEKEFNALTGEEIITEREETLLEKTERLELAKLDAEAEAKAQVRAQAKAAAQAKLAALGLTVEDLTALGL
jgi:hypothetical protein